MKSNLILSLFIFLISYFIIVSCKNNNDLSPSLSIKDFFEQQIKIKSQTFTINASTGGTIIGNQGTQITFYPNSFYSANDGNLLQGNVEVSLVEAYSKGDMLLIDMPTIAINSQKEFISLESGGEFGLKATQNNSNVIISGSISVQMSQNNAFDSNMRLFSTTDTTSVMPRFWQETATILNSCSTGSTSIYCFNTWVTTRYNDAWIWLNCDKPIYVSNPPILKVKLPQKYNMDNTVVRYTAENINGLFSSYLDIDNFFKPISLSIKNRNINIIVVTNYNGSLKYVVKPHFLSTDMIIEIKEQDFNVTTIEQLNNIINSLP